MAVITHLGTANPTFQHKQTSIKQFMLSHMQLNEQQKRLMSIMYAQSGIDYRYSVIPDYSVEATARFFYPQTPDLEPFPSVEHRLNLYETEAIKVAKAAVQDALADQPQPIFTHLITVSCTGLSAPGLDIQLMHELGLSPNIQRSMINYMGCFAAVNAMRQANAICQADPTAIVLVVLVELCTLHFQKENKLDYIMSNLLFGDGAACLVVQGKGIGLQIESFFSQVYLEETPSMAWHVSSTGFLMSLTNEVPILIEENMRLFIENAAKNGQIGSEEEITWAIHPGGRKILEATEKALQLPASAFQVSYDVLRQYGNMSSCTLVFVLKALLQNPDEKPIIGAAFGPGITMESVVLRHV